VKPDATEGDSVSDGDGVGDAVAVPVLVLLPVDVLVDVAVLVDESGRDGDSVKGGGALVSRRIRRGSSSAIASAVPSIGMTLGLLADRKSYAIVTMPIIKATWTPRRIGGGKFIITQI
jgi:hypothetical protein